MVKSKLSEGKFAKVLLSLNIVVRIGIYLIWREVECFLVFMARRDQCSMVVSNVQSAKLKRLERNFGTFGVRASTEICIASTT